jgi:hypothetical protein
MSLLLPMSYFFSGIILYVSVFSQNFQLFTYELCHHSIINMKAEHEKMSHHPMALKKVNIIGNN